MVNDSVRYRISFHAYTTEACVGCVLTTKDRATCFQYLPESSQQHDSCLHWVIGQNFKTNVTAESSRNLNETTSMVFQTQCVLRLVFLLYFVASTGFCWMKLWNCVCRTLWSLFQPTSLFFPLRIYPSLSDACCSVPSRDFAASLSVFASPFQALERVDSGALPALSAMGKATKPSKYSMQRQIKFNKH